MNAETVVQGNWAHLYFNGIYWGLYNLHERIDEHFAEDRFGFDDSEYDVLKQRPRDQSDGSPPEVVNGDLGAWNSLLTTLNGDITTPAVYQSVRAQLDVDSFIDYLILNFWGANLDWPHNNWYAIRHRPTNGPFTFLSWDVENFIYETTRNAPTNTSVNNSPGIIWDRLRRNEEFLIAFADRVHHHCFREGALTSSQNIARFENITTLIRPAMTAESARWGDTREEPPLNPTDHFDPAVAQKIAGYFPARTDFFIDQLRSENLYPSTDAPLLSQNGGQVSPGTTISLSNPNPSGTLYHTLDGLPFLSFTYNDRLPWPESPDGDGPSLVLSSPAAGLDPADPQSWQPSPFPNGSPLGRDTLPFTGDPLADDNGDGLNNLFQFAFSPDGSRPPLPSLSFEGAIPTFSFQRNLNASLTFTVQHSTNLDDWTDLDATLLFGITHLSADTATYTYRSPLPADHNTPQFFRVLVASP